MGQTSCFIPPRYSLPSFLPSFPPIRSSLCVAKLSAAPSKQFPLNASSPACSLMAQEAQNAVKFLRIRTLYGLSLHMLPLNLLLFSVNIIIAIIQ
jgi:hypothetical protein